MKYNPNTHMEDMINDIIKWYDMKEDADGVVVYDNENEKNVGTSCIIVCSCIGDTPSPSW